MSVTDSVSEGERAGSDTAASSRPRALSRTIALVGLMGVGKSTIGRRLADSLGAAFFDSDEEIEKAAGLSVREIFERHGEPEFRRGERRVIQRLLTGPAIVLATGGGAFMDAETRATLKQTATTVWLRADLDVILRRVGRRETRPLLQTGDPRKVLEGLLAQRGPVYAEADLTIDSDDGPHANAVKAICDALGYA